MNLEPTDEQTALRDTVRVFLAERASLSEHVRPLLDDATGMTEAVWRGLAELGTTGLLVPPDYDGAGMTMVEAGIVAEELGAGLHPGPWLSSAVAAARALLRFDVDDDKAAPLFTGIAGGSTVATVVGLGGVGPRADVSGDDAILHGDAGDAWDVAAADTLLVVAETESGLGLFAVPASAPGIGSSPRLGIDQTRKCFRVRFDGMPAQLLATASTAAVEALTDDVTIAWAADALGAAQAVLDLAVDYAKVRRQFGQPIGAFQAVAHLCVDMYETVELARSGVIHALWAADAAGPEERHAAALRTRAFAGRLATVGDTAIQVFGGIGYTWEHDAHLYLKRLLSWSALPDGSDRCLTQLGKQLADSVLSSAR